MKPGAQALPGISGQALGAKMSAIGQIYEVTPLRKRSLLAVCAVVLGGIGILGQEGWNRQTDEPPARRIGMVFQASRPLEPRLSGFPHAPFQARTIQVDRPVKTRPQRLSRVDRLWAQGVKSLLVDKPEAAVQSLEAAAQLDAGNPRLLNDLAAAHLTRGVASDAPFDLVLALSAARKAVAGDPSLPEAWFNLALCLERLYLREPARKAWQGYLELDRTSGWAQEAQEHQFGLQAPVAMQSWDEVVEKLEAEALRGGDVVIRDLLGPAPGRIALRLEDHLLGSWAAAALKGDRTESDRMLEAARRIASALADEFGDFLDRDAVVAVDDSLARPERLAALIRGHLSYTHGRLLYERQEYSAAARELMAARDDLAAGASPLALRADYFVAACTLHRGEVEQALKAFRDLEGRIGDRYPGLQGKAGWAVGMASLTLGDSASALHFYRSALAAFERSRDVGNHADLQGVMAELFDMLGDPWSAWRHRMEALRQLGTAGEPLALRRTLFGAAYSAWKQGASEAALDFLEGALSASIASNDPRAVTEILVWKGRILARAGRSQEATEVLRSADDHAERIADVGTRRLTLASLALARAEALAPSEPDDALSLLQKASQEFEAMGDRRYMILIQSRLASIYREIGNLPAAEEHLEAAIELLEAQGRRIGERELRDLYLDQSADVYDEMVRFQVERGQSARALLYAERGQARGILDPWLRQRAAASVNPAPESREMSSVEDLQRRLPGSTAVLVFRLVSGRLLGWALTDSSLTLREVPLDTARLERMAMRFTRTLATGDEERAQRDGTILWNALIEPFRNDVRETRTLIVVPDGTLHQIPFAALREPGTGRLLIESTTLFVAPSISLYLEALEQADRSDRPTGSDVLIVADPAYDPRLSFELRRLPEARREAGEIARRYPGAQVLLDQEATEERVLGAVRSSRLLHLATHAVAHSEIPALSGFVLAPGTRSREGVLTTRELADLPFGGLRLVVLAGCKTGIGKLGAAEGTYSLARPFLAAGTPAVLVSLWDINDRSSSLFFAEFYQHFVAGHSAAEALRRTQLRFLREPGGERGSAYAWAAFQVIGGERVSFR